MKEWNEAEAASLPLFFDLRFQIGKTVVLPFLLAAKSYYFALNMLSKISTIETALFLLTIIKYWPEILYP